MRFETGNDNFSLAMCSKYEHCTTLHLNSNSKLENNILMIYSY